MKKLILFILLATAYAFPQADSTMMEIQGKATLADTDVLIVSTSDTVYYKITYAQFKALLGALYEASGITESDISDLQAYLLEADVLLVVDSVYRSGSNIVFVQRDGSTFTMVDSTAAAGSGISEAEAITIAWQSKDSSLVAITLGGGAFVMGSKAGGWAERGASTVIDTLVGYGLFPSGTNPTTSATRPVGIDTDDNFVEFYNGTGSRVIPSIIMQSYTILYPDSVQPRSDDVAVAHFPVEIYPHGVTLTYVAISTSASSSDTYLLEEWDDAVGSTQAAIVVGGLVLSTATKVEATSLDNASIAADAYLNVNLDATTDNINWAMVTIGYYANAGD